MRVYLSKKEASVIKRCLLFITDGLCMGEREMVQAIIDRIEMCEQLLESELKAR